MSDRALPLVPPSGLYAHTSDGTACWLAPDLSLLISTPGAHADDPSCVVELPPATVRALLEFVDRVGLVRLLPIAAPPLTEVLV